MTSGADRLRPRWASVPSVIRASVVGAIGGRFVSDSPAQGGFSASYAGVVVTTSGRAFVKACGADWHADSLHFLRKEIRAVSMLAPPLGPSVLATIDTDAGAALVLRAIDGRHPGAPWTTGDLDAIAASMARLSATAAPEGMERAETRMIPGFTRWAQIFRASRHRAVHAVKTHGGSSRRTAPRRSELCSPSSPGSRPSCGSTRRRPRSPSCRGCARSSDSRPFPRSGGWAA